MTRNLKALGLALIAALALSAVAASAASAVSHHFNGTVGDKITSASLTEFQTFESTTGEGKGYRCKKAEVGVGEVETATATSVTAEPKYGECESFGPTAAAEVRPNGCHFTFTGVTTSGNPTGGEHANVHIICTVPGSEIEIRVTALKVKCAAIPAQEIEHAVRYENETTAGDKKTHVKVIATAHGIESTTQGGCGSEVHTNGSYTGNVTVTAPNGVSISNT